VKRKKGRNKMRKKRRCPYCLCESELIERGGKKRNTNKDINKRNKKQHSVQDIKKQQQKDKRRIKKKIITRV